MFSLPDWAAISGLVGTVLQANGTVAPIVNLAGYGQFSGTQISQSLTGYALPQPVHAWLGIDYALQPDGDRRFRPLEQYPEPFEGAQEAASYGAICIQDPTYPYGDQQSEACLNFNVYRPINVPMNQKLPTMVWIHGGAFALYSGRAMDGASFVASSNEPVMVVTFNYRLNSLGFFPSALFERQGLLNLGLRDQKFMLQFLQKHLSSFGGDPTRITLAGLSAGAHSVAFQYFHNYGEEEGKPLFAQAYLESGSPTGRSFPDVRYPRYSADFDELMAYIGCATDGSDEEQLACLRSVPVRKIEEISSKMYAEAESKLSWPFQPAQGGPLLERPGSRGYAEGTFHHLPIITTHTNDEGKYYTPGHLETNSDFIEFWHEMSPYLNHTDLAILNELYPDPAAHPDSIWANSPNSTQYNRISGSWSDMAYICPSRETAYRVSLAGVPTWRMRFNTPNHPAHAYAWRGVPHASDAPYIWNEPTALFPETARALHGYVSSFVATGDPNKFRLPHTPRWPEYVVATSQQARDNSLQLAFHPGNLVFVERDQHHIAQCDFWNDQERATRLGK